MFERIYKIGEMTKKDKRTLYSKFRESMPDFVTIHYSYPPEDAEIITNSKIITTGLNLRLMDAGIQDYIIDSFIDEFLELYKDHALDIYLNKSSLKITHDKFNDSYSLTLKVGIRHAMQGFEKQVEYEFRSQGVEWIYD